jgi:hypothetical protein
VRIFKLKAFARFMQRERITDAMLCKAVAGAERGLVNANLGGGLVKLRVARPGQGKSGGYRTLLAYRKGERSVFLYGFAKNERDNIDEVELRLWRARARAFLELSEDALEARIADDDVMEVYDDSED